ncbi:hypothetical protein BO82DRAFT_360964 [Aspergillus uvarum CBS 121591]|uniref:Capsule polysaccharide biosynthesis protein n=1 Tax=Aspergillus uvarum CBS 121591 TaxID=1448315 RepID=A0A319CPP9_9EURO|nr:hypothetical protein BO82DRAFT_360964 [Aspergillus uvarum CBS 121591]PYH86091.1 hypothetical protein BO82DRAFT_360964 [Aspergillus uvarum CBS 121591]
MFQLPASLGDVETLLSTAWDALTLNRVLVGAGMLFLFSNAKGIPGVWHYRLFKGLLTELLWKRSRQPAPLVDAQGRPRVYSYLVTECANPIIECDYNLHKSNSTFFSDLDINRTQLMMAHFKHVISTSCMPSVTNRKRPLLMAMGGVSCLFHREVKPLQRYEVWSRVLAWDEKWVYVVSYFVKKGALASDGSIRGDPDAKFVLASGLARYVFKEGRVTVKPEGVLRECGLLPPAGEKGAVVDPKGAVGWSKEQFEAENQKGMAVAGGFSGLEVLPSLTKFRESAVLGRYRDF